MTGMFVREGDCLALISFSGGGPVAHLEISSCMFGLIRLGKII